MDKENLLVRVFKEDVEYFKAIQKENKKKGIDGSGTFKEFIEAHKEANKK